MPGDVLLLLPLLFWLPEVGGFELDVPVFDDPVFEVPFAVLGIVPHGELLGDVAGLFVVFGLTVDGCVLLPGVAVFGELEFGALGFGVPLGDGEPGLVGPGEVCGAVAPVGGFTAPVGGAVGEAVGEVGAELCPALLEPPAGRAPPAELWAIAQLAQHNTTDSNVSFRDDMSQASRRFRFSSSCRQITDDPVGVKNSSNSGSVWSRANPGGIRHIP